MSQEELEASLGDVYWSDLSAHAMRDAVILVEGGLDLREAALALSNNDRVRVEAWGGSGALRKPSAEELARWNGAPDTPFRSVIVAPFVLAIRSA